MSSVKHDILIRWPWSETKCSCFNNNNNSYRSSNNNIFELIYNYRLQSTISWGCHWSEKKCSNSISNSSNNNNNTTQQHLCRFTFSSRQDVHPAVIVAAKSNNVTSCMWHEAKLYFYHWFVSLDVWVDFTTF